MLAHCPTCTCTRPQPNFDILKKELTTCNFNRKARKGFRKGNLRYVGDVLKKGPEYMNYKQPQVVEKFDKLFKENELSWYTTLPQNWDKDLPR